MADIDQTLEQMEQRKQFHAILTSVADSVFIGLDAAKQVAGKVFPPALATTPEAVFGIYDRMMDKIQIQPDPDGEDGQ